MFRNTDGKMANTKRPALFSEEESDITEYKRIQNNGLDVYYTPDDVARRCYNAVIEECERHGITPSQYVEPAAGKGSFYNLFPADSRIGIDIIPDSAGIEKDDFISTQREFKQHAAVITNPPFGNNSDVAIEFFNKAAQFASVIGFIVPFGWRNDKTIHKKLARGWQLVRHDDLGVVTYRDPNFRAVRVNTCFQVWVNPAAKCDDIRNSVINADNGNTFGGRLSQKYETRTMGNVLTEIKRHYTLQPGEECREPGFIAKECRIIVRKRKAYDEVAPSGRKRLLLKKGDLVVGMMHTQRGLVAFNHCEEDLHSTGSHRAFAVDETYADKNYVFWALREAVMHTKKNDTVGRENYTVADILTLPLPLPPMDEQRRIIAPIVAAMAKRRAAEQALQEAEIEFATASKDYLGFL